MASTATTPKPCTVCAKPATTHCGGCANDEVTKDLGYRTPTLYCCMACHQSDWNSHKKLCKLKQAQTQLFRAGEILQEVFLATREEACEMPVTKVERWGDDRLRVFGAAVEAISKVQALPFSAALPDGPKVKDTVLSLGGGLDALSGVTYQLGKELLTDFSSKVEEVPIEVLDEKLKTRFHIAGVERSNDDHVVHCVTLADGSTWAVDPAGAQHGQYKPVLRFADYSRGYVAGYPSPRFPYGTSAAMIGAARKQSPLLTQNCNYQIGELHEWVFKNVAVKELLKVKPTEYESLKKSLVAHLAAPARDYVNLTNGYPTSQQRSRSRNTASALDYCQRRTEAEWRGGRQEFWRPWNLRSVSWSRTRRDSSRKS